MRINYIENTAFFYGVVINEIDKLVVKFLIFLYSMSTNVIVIISIILMLYAGPL